jgi:GR25 family glycosyltransferase involved in LPS biosynthesis
MHINDFFDNIIVVNLDRREDRMSKVSDQLKQLNIKYIRQSAVDGLALGISPVDATRMSHLNALMVPGKNLILEDDALFCDDFSNRFENDIQLLPEDWDAMFLGAVFYAPKNNLWLKNIAFTGLQAYCINENKKQFVVDSLADSVHHFDIALGRLNIIRYINSNNLVTQYPSFSDIRLKEVNDFK